MACGTLLWPVQLPGASHILAANDFIGINSLEPDVLEGRKGIHRNRVDRMLSEPRPHAYEHPQVHNRAEHHVLERQLLETVQERFAFRAVPLDGLPVKEGVDTGIP